MIPYGHQSIDKEDVEAVTDVLESDWLTQGPNIDKFEKFLAEYCGAKYAAVFCNGTAALHAAYFAGGLKSGDEFITTPLTFVATANAGLYLGAKPVFSDIEENGNLDPKGVAEKISKKTKALVVVDYAGQPAQLDELEKIAKKNNLVLIEDACHALGAEFKGRKIGSVSDLTVFSFHPVKSITTGEGGAVLTNSKEYYEKLKLFGNHGITKDSSKFEKISDGDWYYEMQELGFNYRLTDIQAALGISQLEKLDDFIKARKKIVKLYETELKKLSAYIELPGEDKDSSSAWHLYVIKLRGELVAKKAEIFRKLRNSGVGVQVHYIPVYWNPYYQKLGYKNGLCPKAESFYESAISLPIFPSLKPEDQKSVIQKLSDILKEEK